MLGMKEGHENIFASCFGRARGAGVGRWFGMSKGSRTDNRTHRDDGHLRNMHRFCIRFNRTAFPMVSPRWSELSHIGSEYFLAYWFGI